MLNLRLLILLLGSYSSVTPRGSTAFSLGESNDRAGSSPCVSHRRGRVWLCRSFTGDGGSARFQPRIYWALCCIRATLVCELGAFCRSGGRFFPVSAIVGRDRDTPVCGRTVCLAAGDQQRHPDRSSCSPTGALGRSDIT